MKKRILSLTVILALCVSIFGTFNVFAETYTQRVVLKSYQPAVKNLIHDDDFNDVEITGTVHAIANGNGRKLSSNYNVSWAGNSLDGYAVSTNDSAVSFSSAWQFIHLGQTSNSDKLVVSFDMYNTDASKLGFRFVNKKYTTNSEYAVFLNLWSSGGSLNFNGKKFANLSSTVLSSLANKWVNTTMVFERTLNSSGTGYEVLLKSFYLDGILYDTSSNLTDSTSMSATTNIDWWTQTENINFYIQNCGADTKYDNIMIYEPAEEGVSTSVNVPDGVPDVKTIVLDDNFESATVTNGTMDNTYGYSFKKMINISSLDEVNNNKYAVTNTWAKFYSKHTGGLPNAGRLVMSFKIKAPESLSSATYYYMGFNSKEGDAVNSLRVGFTPETVTEDETEVTKYKVAFQVMTGDYSGTVVHTSNVYVNPTDFVKYTILMDKKQNSDSTYSAYISEVYINDVKDTVTSTAASKPLRSNWFTTKDSTYSTLYMGNSSVADWALDDFFIYEPVDFAANDVVISSDGTSANVLFTDNIADVTNATVTATLADGSVINSALSHSGKTLTATFDNALDITRNVYTIDVTSGVKSTRNDISSSYSRILGSGFEAVDLSNTALKIRNGGNTVLTGKLIIAAYDSSDNLVNAVVNETDISAPVDLSTNMTYTLPGGDNISYYKFFGWNDAETLTPLFANVTID